VRARDYKNVTEELDLKTAGCPSAEKGGEGGKKDGGKGSHVERPAGKKNPGGLNAHGFLR